MEHVNDVKPKTQTSTPSPPPTKPEEPDPSECCGNDCPVCVIRFDSILCWFSFGFFFFSLSAYDVLLILPFFSFFFSSSSSLPSFFFFFIVALSNFLVSLFFYVTLQPHALVFLFTIRSLVFMNRPVRGDRGNATDRHS